MCGYRRNMAYALNRLCELLGELPERAAAARHQEPHAESALAHQLERTDAFHRSAASDAVLLASLRLTVAEDHLGAIATLIRQGRIVYATYSLARTAAEVASRAWYLLDPDMSLERRVRAGISERLYSLQEQSDLGIESITTESRNRGREIAGEAGRHSYRASGARNGVPKLDGRRHKATQLVEDAIGGEDLGRVSYKLFSAFSHGTGYALTSVLRPTGIAASQGVVWAQVATSAATESNVVALAFLPYRAALGREFMLHGWEGGELNGLVAAISEELRRWYVAETAEGAAGD